MKSEILTNNIFLDTSIFIKENFFAGAKLKAFFKHQEEENITLITSSIIRSECISNLSKYLDDSNSQLKKSLKDLDQKAKAFKNIKSLTSLFELRNTFDFDEERKVLLSKLEENFDDYFDDIEIDSSKLPKIIKDYFEENPPFKKGAKKSEFPDAIALNSLESWCREHDEKMYIVSQDSDMLSFESDYLIPIKEYDKLLEQVSFTYSEENFNTKIEKIISKSEGDIITALRDNFVDLFPSSGMDQYSWVEYEVDSIDQVEIDITDHTLLSSYDNSAEVEITANVKFRAKVSYEDVDTGWYDKETGMSFGREYIKREVVNECDITSNFEIEVELPGKEDVWGVFELVEITNGIPEDLTFETEYEY